MRPSVDQSAADWLARHFAGLRPEEETEFRRWYAADPLHAKAYDELETIWRDLDRVRLPAAQAGIPDPDALAPSRVSALRRWWAPALAAAALTVIAWHLGGERSRNEAAAGPAGPFAESVVTAVGELRRLVLPDGSTLHVNTDSRIEVVYSPAERRVRLLRGEAHFSVAKNPARPFFVEAGGVAVRAVGTAFNIRLRGDAVEVLVTEGRVRVADTARDESLIVRPAPGTHPTPPLLAAGERVLIPSVASADGGPLPATAEAVPALEIERTLAWQGRRIQASAARLSELVSEFNRYNRVQIVVGDPELATRRYGGSFRADDAETFVHLLETKFGLRVERRPEALVLHP